MYKVRVNLDNFVNNIDRVLTINVVKQFLHKMSISQDIRIIMDDKTLDMNKNKLGDLKTASNLRNQFVKTEYREVPQDNEELSLQLVNPDYKELLVDNDMYIKLIPVYHKRTATINIKYYNKSKSSINKVINSLRMLPSVTGQLSYNNIEYFYNLPRYVVALLGHMLYLRNQRFPEDEQLTLEEYSATHFATADLATTLSAEYIKSNVVIREKQVNVIGTIDGDLHNIDAEFDEDQNSWYLTVDYKFNYERPIAMDCHYPMLCYGQLIAKEFRLVKDGNYVDNPDRAKGDQALIDAHLAYEDMLKYLKWNGDYFVYPAEDTETLPEPKIKAARLLTVAVVVDPDDPYTLLGLDDIPGVKFKPDIKEVLYKESDYLSEPYESIFHLELFNNKQKLYSKLYIEPLYDDDDNIVDYTIKSDTPIPVNYVVRVSLSLVYNLNYINTARTQDMIDNFYSVNPEYVDEDQTYPRTLVDTLGVFNVNDNIINYDLYSLDFEPYLNMKTKLISLLEVKGV